MLFVPLAAALVIVLATSVSHRWLPPQIAARATRAGLLAVAVAAIPSLWLISLSYLAHAPLVGAGFRWCAMIAGVHHEIPVIVGLPSVALSIVGAARAIKVIRLDRRLRIHEPGPVEYVDTAEAYAVTVPGRGGRIVVSTGLLDLIDDRELEAVIAHESAHARHRHDRYLLTARAVAAALPPVRPITARLQFALERWADESAARACGDRRVVATALAKAALGPQLSAATLGFTGPGITDRVEALLAASPPRPRRGVALALWTAIAVTASLGAVQLHHLASLLASLCPT